MPPDPARRQTRVVKKLAPDQPGALKLARRYGEALLCVRYRQDLEGLHRYTTVELVIDERPAIWARTDKTIVTVHLGPAEYALKSLAKSHGATWNTKTCLWHMPRAVARELGLLRRIVQK
jgi:hypothetical protein